MLASFKFQAKIPSYSRVCLQGEWEKYTHPSPPLSKDEGLKNTGHSMSIRNLIFGVNSVTVQHLIRYDSLLQNATAILLQNATVITKWDNFITKCDSYYKMQRLLQIATIQNIRSNVFKQNQSIPYELRNCNRFFIVEPTLWNMV